MACYVIPLGYFSSLMQHLPNLNRGFSLLGMKAGASYAFEEKIKLLPIQVQISGMGPTGKSSIG